MESRIKCFFLVLFLPCYTLAESPQVRGTDNELLDPKIERRNVKNHKIDSENFEIGINFGLISIEDFGVNSIQGARLAYHLSEDVFLETSFGFATASETSFEKLTGGTPLLSSDERDYSYYDVSFGYNLFPGQAYVGRKKTLTTAYYLTAGLGSTEFAGDDHFTISFGTGYRLLVNDWLAAHIEFRDHIFDLDVLGENKQTNNFEFIISTTAFF